MTALTRQILEQKRRRRLELAALPFPEKVRIVEQMRETMVCVRASAAQAKRTVTSRKLV